MRVYDSKGRLIVDFKLHADKHTKGGADEVSLAASQITSERFGKTRLEWTAAKLLKGAGAGADPTEIDVPSVPSGLIAIWHGLLANIPSGWVLCDGNNGTPDLLARFVNGVATAATNPGATGGSAAVTLTESQMPAHKHSTYGNDYAGQMGTYDGYSHQIATDQRTWVSRNVSNTGGGSAHENRPPFYDVAFIMKT